MHHLCCVLVFISCLWVEEKWCDQFFSQVVPPMRVSQPDCIQDRAITCDTPNLAVYSTNSSQHKSERESIVARYTIVGFHTRVVGVAMPSPGFS
jgi:hypothetical protein